ncbi:hypothetical protein Tco_0995046 [Tanacetum coccineum]
MGVGFCSGEIGLGLSQCNGRIYAGTHGAGAVESQRVVVTLYVVVTEEKMRGHIDISYYRSSISCGVEAAL